MPKYYLRLGQKLIKDHAGVELPSILSAKGEELAAREILAEKATAGDIIDSQEFEIPDAWGNHMLTVPFKSVLRLR